MGRRWQFWIDRGGTFTDLIARSPDGELHSHKLLSDVGAPERGIRQLLGLGSDEALPACEVRLGTTIATNALLERKGCANVLVISRGFADLPFIGDQTRPDLFALDVKRPTPLCHSVIETQARAAADGTVLAVADLVALRDKLARAHRQCDSLAVCVMHGYAAPELELAIATLAKHIGFKHVVCSHELAAEIGLLARTQTALADAYLTPLLRRYLIDLKGRLDTSSLQLMQSSGDLCDAAQFRGPKAVLSGPAGGVVACQRIAAREKLARVIGFDMGGTSTDVCRVAGAVELRYESTVAGVRLRAPTVDLHTVAAGGGSICRYDGQRLLVGPASAGAHPGPLCYGKPSATALTLTDVNLVLGRVDASHFPFPLDKRPARAALEDIAKRAGLDSAEHAAAGFFAVACQHMAQAIKAISVSRGNDVRDHTLLLFGGASGQHGCALARTLGMTQLLVHPFSGVLSAYGIGLSDNAWHGVADGGRATLSDDSLQALAADYAELQTIGSRVLENAGHAVGELTSAQTIGLCYAGSETTLTLALADAGELPDGSSHEATLRAAFASEHQRLFGYRREGHRIHIVNVRVRVAAAGHPADATHLPGDVPAHPLRETKLWLEDRWLSAPVFDASALAREQHLSGPALLLLASGTLVLEPGFTMRMDDAGQLWLHDSASTPGASIESSCESHWDPIWLELFHNHFSSIAAQMGRVLQRTALSTNIRERLDFSCAVFDHRGRLVANAPHIPVHLGAMEETVTALLRLRPDMSPGDAYITNDPSAGGSHLPDITVVTPVFDAHGQRRFFVASRGHHADIGGITPGSMPADSSRLEQEGVVLRAVRAVHHGHFDEQGLRARLAAGAHPARDIDQNLADLQAQLAANHCGSQLLLALATQYGQQPVAAYMGHIQRNAAVMVEAAIAVLPDGDYPFEDSLDDGSRVQLRITVDGRRMHIDFSGSAPPHPGNFNAPRAVTVAAVLYLLRLLVGQPMPLCSGCLDPITLTIPKPSLLDPPEQCAVAAGNVETSQRIVDVLLGALGLSAASQGTMNNLSFGNERFGYYETLGGGCGASARHDGASAVHSHMTNTRLTDPEVLEARFPVRVHQLAIRRGSGGDGARHGGDGLIRDIEALEPLTVNILSQRRARGPFGLKGGAAGLAGDNRIAGNAVGGCATTTLAAGEHIRIATPGGGGYGIPKR